MSKLSIPQAASAFDIAEVKVWHLIRNGMIKSDIIKNVVCVEENDLTAWFEANPDTLKEWKEALETTRRGFISSDAMRRYRENL